MPYYLIQVNMKKLFILLLLFIVFSNQQSIRAVELEARAGASYSNIWGFHAGAFTAFHVADKFFLQPGVIFNSANDYSHKGNLWRLGLDIPVYASWRIPVNDAVRIRLNAGPFIGVISDFSFGTAVEAGIEYHKYYMGVSWQENFVNQNFTRLNFSVGYKFVL